MIERTFNPEAATKLVTNPAVAEIIETLVSDPNNVFLVGSHGIFLARRLGGGEFEIAAHDEPGAGTKSLKNFIAEATEFMFCHTDAIELLVRTAEGDRISEALVNAAPFDLQFDASGGVQVHALELRRWARWAPGMAERGGQFHRKLAALLPGGLQPVEPDGLRAIGVALAMLQGGQVAKGVCWWNRYCVMARRPMVKLLSTDPPQLKYDEIGVLTLQDGEISVSPLH